MANTLKRSGPGTEVLFKRTKKFGTVDVGIIDAGQKEDSDLTVATIGFSNEFGIGVPERSFIRSTTHEEKPQIIALQKKLLSKIIKGEMTQEEALGLVGKFVAAKIQEKIVAIKDPPNSEETVLKKGSSNPLIDTSQTLGSITYEVNR